MPNKKRDFPKKYLRKLNKLQLIDIILGHELHVDDDSDYIQFSRQLSDERQQRLLDLQRVTRSELARKVKSSVTPTRQRSIELKRRISKKSSPKSKSRTKISPK